MRAHIDTKRRRTRQELVGDVRWGIGWGLWIATGFSAIVLVLAGFRGSTDYPELSLSTGSIILIYYGLALIAGSVLGVLRPFTRSKLGGFFVGWLIGFLVYAGAGLMIKGITLLMVPVAVVLGLGVGGTAGYQAARDNKSKRHAA
jgi:hypothetical protein